MNSTKECSNCAKASSPSIELKACGRCKQTRYCSVDCQKIHWKKGGHKNVCGAKSNLVSTPVAETPQFTHAAHGKNIDDPINPCPICLTNEDDFGWSTQCFTCGQLTCGECVIEFKKNYSNCPTCRTPFRATVKKKIDKLYSLVHGRSVGRHTRVAQHNLGVSYQHGDQTNPT
eukprot:m.236764 g.236764  ORF g.236764 m.236764 type:complete len:173 (+) comp33691_c2_seq16:425-943(+)